MIWGPMVADFVARTIPGCGRGFGPCKALGFLHGGKIVAGIVYHNWSPETGVIEISAAATRRDWLNRARLFAIFEYPFDQVGCRMVVARISEHNRVARRIWRSIGAREYVVPQLRSPTEAEVIYTLARDDWRANKLMRSFYGEAARA